MVKIEKFGIKTGDNDFHETFRVMLPIIADSIYVYRKCEISRAELFDVLHNSVYTFYKATQGFLTNYYASQKDEENSIKGLIDEDRIFINDELTEEINRLGLNLNSDFYCCFLPKKITLRTGTSDLIPACFFVH